jgi:hypothetical protein
VAQEYIKQHIKDPSSVAVYGLDWTEWLDERETTIAQSFWTPQTGSGLAVDSSAIVSGDKVTQVVVSGGTENATAVYGLTNRIITASGLQEERTLGLSIAQR